MQTIVFQFIGGTVENAINQLVLPSVENLIFSLQTLAILGVTLYITLTGYAIATGAVESSFWTFIKQCLKIIVIAAFALSVDGYVEYVIAGFEGLETGLINIMNTGSSSETISIYQLLDASLDKGIDLVAMCFTQADEAGWNLGSALGWIVAGCVIAIGTVLVSIIGGANIIVAKFALAIMFTLGPLFIFALMFPITARFFDSWFSQVLNYIFTLVIMAIIMAFSITAYDGFVDNSNFSGGGEFSPIFSALQIGALTGVLLWIILQASHMAAGLAGGMSMAAMGIRHLMMPAYATANSAKAIRNAVDPMSTRRDMQSGVMTTARRSNHLIAGNTAWNPAYRQHVLQNMGKNWGRAKGGSAKKN